LIYTHVIVYVYYHLELYLTLAFILQCIHYYIMVLVSDIAIFVLKRDVKLQPTNQPTLWFWSSVLFYCSFSNRWLLDDYFCISGNFFISCIILFPCHFSRFLPERIDKKLNTDQLTRLVVLTTVCPAYFNIIYVLVFSSVVKHVVNISIRFISSHGWPCFGRHIEDVEASI